VYDVVLLIERELTDLDARQVTGLHEGLDEPVRYHVVLPVENASAQVHSMLWSMSRYEMVPPLDAIGADTLAQLDAELVTEARDGLTRSVELLRTHGHVADGELTPASPVRALVETCGECGAREAIVLTAPHAVQEFLHVDWASRARRALGIPLLHLLEHETFEEQSGGGEGVSGA
jgi:hypothetical protein